MTARLVQKPVKGKVSCLPIQEELNDNPYLTFLRKYAFLYDKKRQRDKQIIFVRLAGVKRYRLKYKP